MGQALYRKYRPQSFRETVGQDAIINTLSRAIKSGKISHAYLFSGPRGVGKTSVARILAHVVNDLKYATDNSHLDIIEIDAASNRRIDEIRNLREKVHITPTSSKYKVYIIDEVHMLTKEAFNALLKTLEEPPAHCIFILATTEPYKLPETIISRTQHFNFKPISPIDTKKYLQKIAKSENINIQDDALELLVQFGEGSLRDIIGLLDQLSAGGKITADNVRDLLGIPPLSAINELAKSLSQGNVKNALVILKKLEEQAVSPLLVAKALSQHLLRWIIERNQVEQWIADVVKNLLNVTSSPQPQEVLELAILEAASSNQQSPPNNVNDPVSLPAVKKTFQSRTKQSHHKSNKVVNLDVPSVEARPSDIKPFNLDQWDDLLALSKKEVPGIYTALRLASPEVSEEKLTLKLPFALHQKKLKEARHISAISRLVEEVSGSKMIIDCLVDKNLPKNSTPKATRPPETRPLQSISNIFGSAEVLES